MLHFSIVRRYSATAVATALCLLIPSYSLSSSCAGANAVLLHPKLNVVYEQVVEAIADGIRRGGIDNLAVCRAGQSFSSRPTSRSVVFAVGETAARAVPKDSGTAIVTLLVKSLPSASSTGISVFLDPSVVIERALSLRPDLRVLQFVHLAETPRSTVNTVRRVAARNGLRVETISISSVRDAAKAIESLKDLPNRSAAAWFHRGVLGLNPDILVPNLVRLSWDRNIIAIADEADYVERGVLMAVTHNFQKLGELAARAYAEKRKGLLISGEAIWMLNRRTASALGIRLHRNEERAFKSIYE